MFKPTTSFLFAVVFLFRLTVFSAPPPKEVGTSDIEIKAHIAYVGRMVPFSKHNTKAMLDSQRETLAILREKFPKYDEWMKDKPNPQSADIFERNVTYLQKVELVEETFKSVRGDVQQRIEAELRQMPALASIAEKFSWLEARGLSKLKNDLTTNNDSVRGVIVGLAQLLDGSEKAQFFKLGNPEAQLEYLEKKGLTTEQLRSGAFRPEQVGLSRESVTVDAVFNLVRSKLDRSSEILNSLAYLKAIGLAKSAGVTDISRVSSQLNAAEFDFVYRTSSDFLREVAVQMASKENLPETAFAQWMRSFQSNLPKAIFHTSLHAVENRKLIGSIYEAPPHLAVYRGCIGGDCSTTRSAFYPYSPWEHVFYIKNERNEFVGYASVTRVKSKGVETFYLKDLTGANMSPEVARAAMFAFRQMISAYGAKRFAIASPTFTNAQNHNSSIVRMLGEYNKSSDRVPLKFQDAAIRDVLRNELKVAYQTSSAYDDPRSHEEGILLSVREPDAVRYAVEVKAGGLPEYSTEELAAELVRVIREVIVNRQKVEGISRILTTSEIEEAVRVITNKGKFSLIGYYRTVNKLLAQYGIQFSRDWLFQDNVRKRASPQGNIHKWTSS